VYLRTAPVDAWVYAPAQVSRLRQFARSKQMQAPALPLPQGQNAQSECWYNGPDRWNMLHRVTKCNMFRGVGDPITKAFKLSRQPPESLAHHGRESMLTRTNRTVVAATSSPADSTVVPENMSCAP
jgi:hypothetical protein